MHASARILGDVVVSPCIPAMDSPIPPSQWCSLLGSEPPWRFAAL